MTYSSEFSMSEIPANLRSLYLYWQDREQNGPPRLDMLNITRLPGGLDNASLTEVHRGPDGAILDFEAAFLGKSLRDSADTRMVGRRFSELPGKGPGAPIWEGYTRLARDGRPLLAARASAESDSGQRREILLPLGGDGHPVQFVLEVFGILSDPRTLRLAAASHLTI